MRFGWQLRALGNAALQKGQAAEALELYSAALAACPPHHTHLLYTNRASAHLALVRTPLLRVS